MTINAHSKLNLSLRILGKREDGFHGIESLMVPIELHDTLDVKVSESGPHSMTCSDPSVPVDEKNLVLRAAALFQEKLERPFGFTAHLEKRIPHGAGLGGGSSDAASTLCALNALLAAHFTHDTLRAMALQLGSDIPFFINARPAWARGRGELLEPAPGIPSLPILILKPPFGVPTPWAYKRWSELQARGEEQAIDNITLVNDMEPPVFEKYLLLPTMKSWLLKQSGVRAAMMSGSGSTIFAVLQTPELGAHLAQSAKSEFGETLWTWNGSTIS